jgi:hypothetical protein
MAKSDTKTTQAILVDATGLIYLIRQDLLRIYQDSLGKGEPLTSIQDLQFKRSIKELLEAQQMVDGLITTKKETA